jgi:hypothetical protein
VRLPAINFPDFPYPESEMADAVGLRTYPEALTVSRMLIFCGQMQALLIKRQ